MRLVVTGAGPTALGFLYRFQELGEVRADHQIFVLEQSEEPGGLARSVQDPQGFLWDMGGHVTFSHYEYYTRIIDAAMRQQGNGWADCVRASYVFLQGKLIGYPIQHNLHCLDEPEKGRCIGGLVNRPSLDPTNFDEWILAHFGEPLADLFMRPYNRKLWGVDPRRMSHAWVGDRVAVPTLAEIKASSAVQNRDTGWGPNRTFRFPLHGGTGSVWKGVARLMHSGMIHFRNTVTAVNLGERRLALTDSSGTLQTLGYDVLINTAPLDILLALISDGDPAVRACRDQFVYNKVHVVGIGLQGEAPEVLRGKSWVYFPDPAIPFYRMTVFSSYAPANAPPGCWSLLLECSEPMGSDGLSCAGVLDACQKALARLNFIEEGRVVSRFHTRLDRGYPVPCIGRDEVLGKVLAYLEAFNVYSRGRFGGWKYEVSNQDHSFMQGVELADYLLLGVPELTFPSPAYVNAQVRPGRVPRPRETQPAVEWVIAHFREDLSWLEKIKHLVHVYHKGGMPERYDFKFWERLPNVGREAHTHLHHIVCNYDTLSDVTVFLQGAVADHGIDDNVLFQWVHRARTQGCGFPAPAFHGNWGRIDHFGKFLEALQSGQMRQSPYTLGEFWLQVFRSARPHALQATYFGCFSVRRDRIRRRPKEFYERLLMFLQHPDPEEAHYLERLWFTIFATDVA